MNNKDYLVTITFFKYRADYTIFSTVQFAAFNGLVILLIVLI